MTDRNTLLFGHICYLHAYRHVYHLLPTCIQTRVSLDEPALHNQKAGGITQCTHYYTQITGAPLNEQAAVTGTLYFGLTGRTLLD